MEHDEDEEIRVEAAAVELFLNNGNKLRIQDAKEVVREIVIFYEAATEAKRISIYSPYTGRKYVINPRRITAMVSMEMGDNSDMEITEDDSDDADDKDSSIDEFWETDD